MSVVYNQALMNYRDYLNKLLDETEERVASDLHLNVGLKPHLRIDGALEPMTKEDELTAEAAEGIVGALLNAEQKERFTKERQLDFAYNHNGGGSRFRVNAYYQKGYVSAALRLIPSKILTMEELGLPQVLHGFSNLSQGFVLVVGPAGHGKSTTLATIIDEINHNRRDHIITVEDPIEYIFTPVKSIVSQREIGIDTPDFTSALRSVLRQDPDVIMVGEMRDVDSIAIAMTAAETGHLVLSTLHTNSAAQTIDRIIDSFPAEKQSQAATQLAATLVGIISKRLLPKIGGGRVPAVEIMLTNPAVRNLIRDRKTHQLDLVIETNLKAGMLSMNRSLAQLIKDKKVTTEAAELYSPNPEELKILVKKL